MAAIAWDIALLIDRKRIVALSILCGLMTFIRPELAFLAIASMAVVFWEHRCSAESVKAVAICALVLLPLLAWYWIDTGSPIPSTIGAKTYFFAQRFLPLRIKLILLIRDLIPALAAVSPLFLCAGFIRPPAVRRILLLFTAVFLASYLWRFPSGFAENDERYLFPFVPIILFSVACGLSSSRRQERAIAISCVVLSLLFVPFGIIHQFRNYREYLTGYRLSLDDTVRWMNRNLPAGSIVMLHDAGYAAYAGHFALVDLAGLKTPAAAEINKHLTYPSAGRLRAEAIAQIAAQFHPGYLLTFHGWDHAFQFANALRDHGWTVRQIYEGRAPVGTPAQDVYVLYQLQPPQ
ncbi:MAG TPA: hypothetical protein VMF50_05935 [Candidatus Binataceae bacterium]|nr:hypothetical protein [Candidatus Binataceae bacterium]